MTQQTNKHASYSPGGNVVKENGRSQECRPFAPAISSLDLLASGTQALRQTGGDVSSLCLGPESQGATFTVATAAEAMAAVG